MLQSISSLQPTDTTHMTWALLPLQPCVCMYLVCSLQQCESSGWKVKIVEGHCRSGLITQRKEDSLTGKFMMFDFPIQGVEDREKGGEKVKTKQTGDNRENIQITVMIDMKKCQVDIIIWTFCHFFCCKEGRRILTCNNKVHLNGLCGFFVCYFRLGMSHPGCINTFKDNSMNSFTCYKASKLLQKHINWRHKAGNYDVL